MNFSEPLRGQQNFTGARLMRPSPWRWSPALALAALMLGGCPNNTPAPGPGTTTDSDAAARLATGLLNVSAQDHVYGSATALVTVVAYEDFECPLCGSFERDTFPTIKREYIDTGRVRWVFRHFPLRAIHPDAENAARASECASDQGQFFQYHDLLFSNQDTLAVADLKRFAAGLGLNAATFDPCLDDGQRAARVQGDLNSGTTLGVPGTPTFFINGKILIGAKSIADFRSMLDTALAAAGG